MLLILIKIYVKLILVAVKFGLEIYGMVYIIGGGLLENLFCCLLEGMFININRSSWEVFFIFRWIFEVGNVNEEGMFNIFNMGIGFVVLVFLI